MDVAHNRAAKEISGTGAGLRHGRRPWLGCAVLACAMVGLSICLAPRDNSLNARTVRLVRTDGWREQSEPDYYWLNNEEILYFEPQDAQHIRPVRRRVMPPGVKANPVALPPIRMTPRDTIYEMSPDGKWITCCRDKDDYRICPLGTLNTSHDVRMSSSITAWTHDSKAVVDVKWQTDPRFGATMRATGRWTYADGRRPQEFGVPKEFGNSSWIAGLLGVLSDGQLLFMRDANWGSVNQPPWTGYTFGQMDPARPALAPHIWTVPRQQDVLDAHVSLSARGDRLIWTLGRQYTPPLEALLHRLYPKFSPEVHYRVSWCVSRLDGSGMREAACFDTLDPRYLGQPAITWPRLTPDNKNISFVRDGWLCIVPVE